VIYAYEHIVTTNLLSQDFLPNVSVKQTYVNLIDPRGWKASGMGKATKQDCGKVHQTPPEHNTTVIILYLDTLSLIWDYHTAIKIVQ